MTGIDKNVELIWESETVIQESRNDIAGYELLTLFVKARYSGYSGC